MMINQSEDRETSWRSAHRGESDRGFGRVSRTCGVPGVWNGMLSFGCGDVREPCSSIAQPYEPEWKCLLSLIT